MYPKKLHKFGAAMMEIMMKMRRWRMLKAMGIPRNIIGVEAAVLGQMPLVATSERRVQVQGKAVLMVDERRSSFIV
jgi:hypothetical protein